MHIFPYILQSKDNQAMRLGQVMEYNKRNHAENEAEILVPDLFFCFSSRTLFFILAKFFFRPLFFILGNIFFQLSFDIFRQSSIQDAIKTNCIKLQTIDPEICSNLNFQKRIQFFHHILSMIFQEKCFSCYILLTDQILLPDCLYFLKYWLIFVLQLFFNQVVTS